ncbi:MAG: amidohydrolase family protein [Nanoarchaeota archaeon]
MKWIRKRTRRKALPLTLVVVVLLGSFFILNSMNKEITGKVTAKEIQGQAPPDIQKIIQQEIQRRTQEITQQIVKKQPLKDNIAPKTSNNFPLPKETCFPPPRQFSYPSYYTGPLIEDHLHMPTAFKLPAEVAQQADWDPPSLTEVTGSEIVCQFDQGKIKTGFGFYLVANLFPSLFINAVKDIEAQYPERIVPFLMTPHLTSLDPTPEEIEQIILAHPGLFKGLGEIAFYRASYKDRKPDDAYFQELYKIADRHNLVVMIHLDDSQQQSIENVLNAYPAVTFLFHGEQMEPYLSTILNKYPNTYYSVDANLFDLPHEQTIGNLYDAQDAEEFVAEIKDNFERILETNLDLWKSNIEKYPDRYLWGTDRAAEWNFEPEVAAIIDEMSRTFIGHLDPEVQEKFAYKNAERLLNRRKMK